MRKHRRGDFETKRRGKLRVFQPGRHGEPACARELHADELNSQLNTTLRLRTGDNPKTLDTLIGHGFHAFQTNPSWIEIKDIRAIENPSSITRLLTFQGMPPDEIYIEQENLEQFFLRTLKTENPDD